MYSMSWMCFILYDFVSLWRAEDPKEETKPEIDDKFWELLLSADKKDYESICAQYGVTDFRGMLKKLNEKKIEREQEQEKVFFNFIYVSIWINYTIKHLKYRNITEYDAYKEYKLHTRKQHFHSVKSIFYLFVIATGCWETMQPKAHWTERTWWCRIWTWNVTQRPYEQNLPIQGEQNYTKSLKVILHIYCMCTQMLYMLHI